MKPTFLEKLPKIFSGTPTVHAAAPAETLLSKIKPLIKPRYPQNYDLEWGEDIQPAVLTHLVRLCDFLSGYVDQDAVSVGKLAYRVVHHTDVQDSVICLMFEVSQEEAVKIRKQLIGKKKL